MHDHSPEVPLSSYQAQTVQVHQRQDVQGDFRAYPEIAGSLPIAVAIHALVIQGEAAAAKGIAILGVHVIVLPCFRMINDGIYHRSQTYQGFGFRFLVQFNHLLLRIALAPGTEVGVDESIGVRPIRIYPEPDEPISTVPEYPNSKAFEDALVLRTWKGCPGNIHMSCD